MSVRKTRSEKLFAKLDAEREKLTPAERMKLYEEAQAAYEEERPEREAKAALKKARDKENSARYRAKQKAEQIARNEKLVKLELKDAKKKAREEKAQEELLKGMTYQQRWRYRKKIQKLKEDQLIKEEEQKRLALLIESYNKQPPGEPCKETCATCSYFVDLYEAKNNFGVSKSVCRLTMAYVKMDSDRCRDFKCFKKKASRVRLKNCNDCRYRLQEDN